MRGPIARATIRTSSALALRVVVQAGSLLLVARLLGPEDFGAFAGVAALAVMLGTLSTFGIHLVLFEEVSKAPERRTHVLRYALPVTMVAGAMLLLVFFIISVHIASDSGLSAPALIAIGVSEVLLQPLMALLASEQAALGKPARSQLLQLTPLILRLLAAIYIAASQMADALNAFSYAYFLATAMALIVALRLTRIEWPGPKAWRWPSKQELGGSSGYAALNITAIGPTELDKTLSTALLPLSAAGLYASAARVVGAVTLPVTALILSALPHLYREGGDRPAHTSRLVHWVIATSALYGFAMAAALWCFAPLLVGLFGDGYDGVDDFVRWICAAVPAMSLRMTAGSIIMGRGKPWTRAGLELMGLVILAVAAFLLTGRIGAGGMPLALACAEWSMAVAGLVLVYRTDRYERRH